MQFRALLKKEFREIGYRLFRKDKNGKRRTGKGTVILLVLAALLIAFSFFGMGAFFCDTMHPLGLDWMYFAVMGIIALILGLVGDVVNTYAAIFRAKDTEILLSMPIPPLTVLLARMVSIYLTGLIWEAIAFVPAMAVYWIHAGFTLVNVLFPIVTLLLIGFLVLTLSCLLGWIIALLASVIKSKIVVTVFTGAALIAVYYFCYFRMDSAMDSLAENAADIAESIRSSFYPLFTLGSAAAGDAVQLLLFTAGTLVLFALCCLILSATFVRISTRSHGTKRTGSDTVRSSSVAKALFVRELRHFISSPAYMLNCGLGLILMLGLAVLGALKAPEMLAFFQTGELSTFARAVPMLALGVVILLAGMAPISSPSVSLEGKTLWLIRSLPVKAADVLRAKWLTHFVLCVIPGIVSCVVLGIACGAGIAGTLLMVAATVAFTAFDGAAGLALGVSRPILDWTNESVPIKTGSAMLLSMLIGLASALLAIGIGALIAIFAGVEISASVLTVVFALGAYLLWLWLRSKGTARFDAL